MKYTKYTKYKTQSIKRAIYKCHVMIRIRIRVLQSRILGIGVIIYSLASCKLWDVSKREIQICTKYHHRRRRRRCHLCIFLFRNIIQKCWLCTKINRVKALTVNSLLPKSYTEIRSQTSVTAMRLNRLRIQQINTVFGPFGSYVRTTVNSDRQTVSRIYTCLKKKE